MFLNTERLPAGHTLIAKMPSLGFTYAGKSETLYLIVSDTDLYFIEKSPALNAEDEDEPGFDVYQSEFPREAAQWIVDTIENKLWKSATEGGLPPGVTHLNEIVQGENLKVRRVMNVGGPGQKGFSLMNFSRHHPTLKFQEYNEIQVTDEMLREGGLLDILRDL